MRLLIRFLDHCAELPPVRIAKPLPRSAPTHDIIIYAYSVPMQSTVFEVRS